MEFNAFLKRITKISFSSSLFETVADETVCILRHNQFTDEISAILKKYGYNLDKIENTEIAVATGEQDTRIYYFPERIEDGRTSILTVNCPVRLLKELISSQSISLHLFYCILLFYKYLDWNGTKAYDRQIELLNRLSLPATLKQMPADSNMLYRGLVISRCSYRMLTENKRPFTLKKRVGTSWTKDPKRALSIAEQVRDRKGLKYGETIIIAANPDSRVIINGYNIKHIPEAKRIMDLLGIREVAFNEVILADNGGLTKIELHNLVEP